MDADGLSTELLNVLTDHFLFALFFHVANGFGLAILLLDSQVAHLTSLESLLNVGEVTDILFKRFQVVQILGCSVLMQVSRCFVTWDWFLRFRKMFRNPPHL